MYLPQFHRVKENDEWWGEGFTEWNAVREARPLFDEHYQPHQPFCDNYYNLLEKDTMEWQAQLMHKYGVDAMCFYHYWFKDGRRILEKPAENLLKWKDINMPFCFSWANETWARSWSNVRVKNTWADTYEKKMMNDDGVLLEQKYGNEADWKEHFEYLLPFFRDDRYVKVDNKPLLLIYNTYDIHCINDMLCCWRRWAIENGLEGLYVIGGRTNGRKIDNLDANIDLQPGAAMQNITNSNVKLQVDYDLIWNVLLQGVSNEGAYYQGVVSYDDTPRRGQNGKALVGATPENFKKHFVRLLAKSHIERKDIVFLNAWNEWGEGMHLEPDQKYGFGFLEAVKWSKEHYQEYLDEMQMNILAKSSSNEEYNALKEKCSKYEIYWRVLDAWLSLKEQGISIADRLIEMGYKNIAIYGVGMMGMHLIEEFKKSDVNILYLIDRRAKSLTNAYPIYSMEDNLPEKVDAIILTVTYDYTQIEYKLREKGNFTILHLENLIRE